MFPQQYKILLLSGGAVGAKIMMSFDFMHRSELWGKCKAEGRFLISFIFSLRFLFRYRPFVPHIPFDFYVVSKK